MLPYFSSVPGQAGPGQMTIGGPTGPGGVQYWLFLGNVPLYYLDYLNAAMSQTLAAEPGIIYGIVPASGHPNASAVPPPDGRWSEPGGGFTAMLMHAPVTPPVPTDAEKAHYTALLAQLAPAPGLTDPLALARDRSVRLQVLRARGETIADVQAALEWEAAGGSR